MSNFDLIVLGGGPGGYVAAIRAAQLGLKTAVVEREAMGGICLNWGCIPTKALLKSAQVFEYIKHAGDYGIQVSDARQDFNAVVSRSRKVADGMSKGVGFLMKKNNIHVLMGAGRTLPGGKLEVTDASGKKQILSAPHIIIATGGRARQLPNIPIDGKRVIEYRKAMSLENQPESILIVGSGAIGVEFAYFFNAMGTRVHLVEFMPRIVPVEDEEISRTLEKIYKKAGIDIHTGTLVESVKVGDKGCVSMLKSEKGKLLVDDFYRTGVSGYYAIGDVVKGPALAHVASAEGIICVEKIAGHHPEPLDYGNIPGCTYCSPEIASVGMTEQAARDAGYDLKVGRFPFSASGKASAAGHKDGLVKLVFDARYGELLGAHMIGANVTEMIAEAVVARKLETTGPELIKSVHPHPTMSEAMMEAAAAAYGEVIHL
jgi:dihydrolipoamide dehydrogenase